MGKQKSNLSVTRQVTFPPSVFYTCAYTYILWTTKSKLVFSLQLHICLQNIFLTNQGLQPVFIAPSGSSYGCLMFLNMFCIWSVGMIIASWYILHFPRLQVTIHSSWQKTLALNLSCWLWKGGTNFHKNPLPSGGIVGITPWQIPELIGPWEVNMMMVSITAQKNTFLGSFGSRITLSFETVKDKPKQKSGA